MTNPARLITGNGPQAASRDRDGVTGDIGGMLIFWGGVEAPKGGETITANDKQGNALWRRSLGGIHERGAGCTRFLKRKSKKGWLCGFVMERPYLGTYKEASVSAKPAAVFIIQAFDVPSTLTSFAFGVGAHPLECNHILQHPLGRWETPLRDM